MSPFPLPLDSASPDVRNIDVIDSLRTLMPRRAMNWSEAHSIAERQATLLLELVHVTEPYVPQFVISNLPGLFVDWRKDWPTDATAFQADTHWRIVIRSTDVVQRQRFSLAHEFKHVLDDPVIDRISPHLPAWQRQGRAERLCNWFAACFLMPRAWIKRDWCNRIQNVHELARRYYVSDEAMELRLSELGLTPMTLALEKKRRHSGGA